MFQRLRRPLLGQSRLAERCVSPITFGALEPAIRIRVKSSAPSPMEVDDAITRTALRLGIAVRGRTRCREIRMPAAS